MKRLLFWNSTSVILPPMRLVIAACLFTALCTFPPHLFSQIPPHPTFRQFSTSDGLPSPETYCILQDQRGFIWIATDNGVSRFDGYGFRNYGLKDGLIENVIFSMDFDAKGRLWMQAMSGNLYYMEHDSIHAFRHNKVLETLPERPGIGGGFIIEKGGETVHISTYKYGVISISKNGTITRHEHPDPTYSQGVEKEGKFIFAIYNYTLPDLKEAEEKKHPDSIPAFPIYFHVNDEIWSFPNHFFSKNKSHTAEAFFLDKGKYLFQVSDDVWYIENGKSLWHHHFPHNIKFARLLQGGKLYLGLSRHNGLRVFDSLQAFRENKGNLFLPGKTINYVLADNLGDLWIATHEDGIFHCPMDAFFVYDKESGLREEKVTALTIKNSRELFVGFENGEVWTLDILENHWNKLPEIPDIGAVSVLHFDQKENQLWASRVKLFFLQDNQWEIWQGPDESNPYIFAGNITTSPKGNRLWISGFQGFQSIDLPQRLVGNACTGADQRTLVAREDFSGRIWVGRQKGLFEWKNNKLLERQALYPAFALRVEDIALLSDSTLAIATKGAGVVFWKNGRSEQITTAQGLTADMMESLWADDTGYLWAGTLNGLNCIKGAWGQRTVEQFTVFHGLPSNEINCIRTQESKVWAATNKGLVYFSKTKKTLTPQPPFLESLHANHHAINMVNLIQLPSTENNLTIQFSAINYKMYGKIPYRYRMDQGNWTTTFNRSVNFPALAPGKKQFEVQAQNEDGQWSASTCLDFEILPPWYNTWWAKCLVLFTLATVGPAIYFFRTSQLKKAHRMQLKIADLERSALQAQMNPHFIFNCLNSIQNFILQNEKQDAIFYLSSFASLVRSMLNASRSGKIALSEEIKLLNNYLELEKLRFKNRFEYSIKTQAGLDVFDIKIPPLLVQPYVENAVKHGISGKNEGGKVDVFFKLKEGLLEISIRDNGPGINFENEQEENAKTHKSVGMSITRHRLKLLSQGSQENQVKITNLFRENGKPAGTEVFIQIGITGDVT